MKKRPIPALIALAFAAVPGLVLAQAGVPAPQQSQQPGASAATPAGTSMTVPTDLPLNQPLGTPPLPDPAAARRAPEANALQFRGIAGLEYDDNVLRTNTNEQSDMIGVLGVGLRFDRLYGQQRFLVDAEANTFRHQDLDNLDYTTLNYNLAWYWRFTSAFEGIASAERRQYRDITETVGAIGQIGRRTERNELLEGGWRFGGGWRALAGVERSSVKTSDPRAFDANPEVQSFRLGASYEFGSGSVITGRIRRGDGEYTNAPGVPGFDDNEVEAVVRWAATAKTTVDARLAYLERNHDAQTGRDFSGLVGFANVSWDITAKTRLVAGASRDLGSYIFSPAGHVESTRFFVAPVWRVTDQVALNARYERTEHDWRDVTAGSPDVGRNDKIDTLGVGVEWNPRRAVTVTGGLRNERRNSNLPAADYRANVITVGLKVTL